MILVGPIDDLQVLGRGHGGRARQRVEHNRRPVIVGRRTQLRGHEHLRLAVSRHAQVAVVVVGRHPAGEGAGGDIVGLQATAQGLFAAAPGLHPLDDQVAPQRRDADPVRLHFAPVGIGLARSVIEVAEGQHRPQRTLLHVQGHEHGGPILPGEHGRQPAAVFRQLVKRLRHAHPLVCGREGEDGRRLPTIDVGGLHAHGGVVVAVKVDHDVGLPRVPAGIVPTRGIEAGQRRQV